ncbi:type III secretion system inner membrane ring lipoprotein SctJ [Robbsia andropogonis]|uniref:type III secretion system inner membrane ring lipoprotein SctJ n=1 Tax=Robbsia andropogonis TaxID=28092 RepID=UPI0009E4562D|nr:type III secretion inner membrane ring lipoprotein SctJ [Robbsia andropogonis]
MGGRTVFLFPYVSARVCFGACGRHTLRFFSFAGVLVLSACHSESLLSGLSETQVNNVVAVLQRHGVTAIKRDLGKGVYEVDVARQDFPAAVDLARKFDLPQPADIQISQAFPADSLISTPLAEHSRLISYIEQRLSSNLNALDHVVRARVNVSYPLTGDIDGPQKMHVAVLIIYSGEVDEDTLISEVKRYVKNSFEKIDYDDISVLAERSAPVFHALPAKNVETVSSTGAAWIGLSATLTMIIGILALVAAVGFGIQSRLATPRWRARHGDDDIVDDIAPTERKPGGRFQRLFNRLTIGRNLFDTKRK